jgi:hypothetical protein
MAAFVGTSTRRLSAFLAVDARGLAGLQWLGGAVLIARPRAITQVVGGASPPTPLVRLLGARMLAQGVVDSLHPTRGVILAGVGLDAAHALSMLAAAARYPDYRRAALASAAVASVAAALGTALVRSGR